MSARRLVDELAAAGVYLYVDGDRLRYRARPGGYSDELRRRVDEHRAELIALLATPPGEDLEPDLPVRALPPFDPATSTPPAHWRAVAGVDPLAGLVGLVGPAVAGEMLGAAQRWESAVGVERDEATQAYAAIWSRAANVRRTKGRHHEPLR